MSITASNRLVILCTHTPVGLLLTPHTQEWIVQQWAALCFFNEVKRTLSFRLINELLCYSCQIHQLSSRHHSPLVSRVFFVATFPVTQDFLSGAFRYLRTCLTVVYCSSHSSVIYSDSFYTTKLRSGVRSINIILKCIHQSIPKWWEVR